jgi:hypothetical protein
MLEVCRLDWRLSPFRGQRFMDLWEPAVEKCTAYGAKAWFFTRSENDQLLYEQLMVWEKREHFDAYWYSKELEDARASVIKWYGIPMVPSWHTLISGHAVAIHGGPLEHLGAASTKSPADSEKPFGIEIGD